MSTTRNFRYFKTSPEIIRLLVMMYVRYPLSLRNVEDLLHDRGIDITRETVRFWRNRFRTIFAAEIRRNRVPTMRSFRQRQVECLERGRKRTNSFQERVAGKPPDPKFAMNDSRVKAAHSHARQVRL